MLYISNLHLFILVISLSCTPVDIYLRPIFGFSIYILFLILIIILVIIINCFKIILKSYLIFFHLFLILILVFSHEVTFLLRNIGMELYLTWLLFMLGLNFRNDWHLHFRKVDRRQPIICLNFT
jgi:hypothetical protein